MQILLFPPLITTALLRDGKIVAGAQEEGFSNAEYPQTGIDMANKRLKLKGIG